MLRYLPVVIAVAALAGAGIYDRIIHPSNNVEAQQWATVLETLPVDIGDWKGTDAEVDEEILRTAGAVGKISRTYTNAVTDESVNVWLIVGHMQGVYRHTPNICYRASGHTQGEKQTRYTMQVEGQPPAEFYTAWFERTEETGINRARVFWGWCKPVPGEPITWQAPGSPRQTFAATPALFKLYFTTSLPDPEQKKEDNISNEFAKEFLPVINGLLEKGIEAQGS